jgi:hydroxyacylglutathione hydrolase|tara:strand:+ start:17023 stop:18435 length:1413 start_codon:yes stop_codon:yes gene_type:complete
MEVQQIYTNCLAQGAYYIESNGEVAIIDPLREVQQYIDLANSRGAKIKYILETHFHADFVSGHLTLSELTGAPIIFGPNAETNFPSTIAKDGDELILGDAKIRVIHTPGHTMESTCYLLLDENGKENSLFSGDTLFLGDVGRPDLAQKAASMTMEDLAGILYDSLRNKIMTLPDDVTVYPGHGAGSACGKSMSKETIGLLGEQKQTNYALRADMTKEEFVKELTDGLAPPPAYFPLNVQMNKEGYTSIEDVLKRGKKALSPADVEKALENKGTVLLDVRHQSEFSKAHIPGSLFIGLDGQFAPWVGAIIADTKTPIILVVDEERLEEAITRLSRVGFDNILGYLKGGIPAWAESERTLDDITSISAEDLENKLKSEKLPLYDVRKEGEFLSAHIVGAKYTPLDELKKYLDEFPEEETFYLHCAGGYRSVIAMSILKANGIHNGIDILGGFGALKLTGLPKEENVCASTLR